MHPLLRSVPPTLQQATTDPHLRWRFLDTRGHVWVSFLWDHWSFLLGLGTHKVLFVPSKSLFPVLCKFYNQIPLASKVKFLGSFQSLCQIPRLGNLLGPRNSTIYLEVKEIALSYFKAYYKAIVIKTVWFWHKDRSNKKK